MSFFFVIIKYSRGLCKQEVQSDGNNSISCFVRMQQSLLKSWHVYVSLPKNLKEAKFLGAIKSPVDASIYKGPIL